jgi:hypothetical protein
VEAGSGIGVWGMAILTSVAVDGGKDEAKCLSMVMEPCGTTLRVGDPGH